MSKFYKIIIALFIVFVAIISYPIYASTTYTVETKYGEKSVVIPDGYTDKDVLLLIAKSYYEQNEEYKETQEALSELTENVNKYIAENNKLTEEYDDLLSIYEVLVSKYDTLNKMNWLKGFAGGNIHFDAKFNLDGAGIEVGAYLFDKVLLTAGVNYNTTYKFNFTAKMGFTF